MIGPSEKAQTCPGSSDGAARSDQVWEGGDGGGVPDSEPGPEVIPERHPELLAGFHQAQERVPAIAAFVRICRNADRMELLRAIILRWPDITLDELWWGMRLAAPTSEGSNLQPSAAKADALSC